MRRRQSEGSSPRRGSGAAETGKGKAEGKAKAKAKAKAKRARRRSTLTSADAREQDLVRQRLAQQHATRPLVPWSAL